MGWPVRFPLNTEEYGKGPRLGVACSGAACRGSLGGVFGVPSLKSTGRALEGSILDRQDGRVEHRHLVFGEGAAMTGRPHPVRILEALEQQPEAWHRAGPRSIENDYLAIRLTLGIITVRIECLTGGVPEPVRAEPPTRDRITALVEARLFGRPGAADP